MDKGGDVVVDVCPRDGRFWCLASERHWALNTDDDGPTGKLLQSTIRGSMIELALEWFVSGAQDLIDMEKNDLPLHKS